MNEVILYLINFLHIIFILFVVITPFLNINFLLGLHFIIVPFVIFHWLLNDNKCGLTLLEMKLRGNDSKESCVTCKLIEPIYDFKEKNKSIAHVIYVITIALWIITAVKICYKCKNGTIKSIDDFYFLK